MDRLGGALWLVLGILPFASSAAAPNSFISGSRSEYGRKLDEEIGIEKCVAAPAPLSLSREDPRLIGCPCYYGSDSASAGPLIGTTAASKSDHFVNVFLPSSWLVGASIHMNLSRGYEAQCAGETNTGGFVMMSYCAGSDSLISYKNPTSGARYTIAPGNGSYCLNGGRFFNNVTSDPAVYSGLVRSVRAYNRTRAPEPSTNKTAGELREEVSGLQG
jgi:hypothetical protein